MVHDELYITQNTQSFEKQLLKFDTGCSIRSYITNFINSDYLHVLVDPVYKSIYSQ